MLVERGRLLLSMDVDSWLVSVTQIDPMRFLPIDVDVALKSVMLPEEFQKDPADRMIVATACKLVASLVIADEKIHGYPHVSTIW